MLKSIGREINRLKISAIIALALGIVISIAVTVYWSHSMEFLFKIEMWEMGTEWVVFLLPLFVSIPFCYEFFFEVKDGFLKNVCNRTHIKKYLQIKYFSGAICSFVTVFLILFTSLIVALYLLDINFISTNMTNVDFVFATFRNYHPLLYGTLLSLWTALVGVIFFTMTYFLALVTSNIFIALTGAFVYFIVENFVLAILSVPEFRLVSTVDPTSVTSFTPLTGLVGVALASFCLIALILFSRKKEIL